MIKETANMFTLTKNDTSVMKGIAIIAMLCHHVYTCEPTEFESYFTLLITIGVLGKACVAMFLFCSGYGLAIQYAKIVNATNGVWNLLSSTIVFIVKRLIRFYSAYWFVFLIFVPITIFCFDRPLSIAYGEYVSPTNGLVLDLLGWQGFQSYNITWWFNKLIILLYFLFPILFVFVKKTKWFGLLLCFIIMRFANKLEMIDYYELLFWQFPVVLGVGWTLYQDKITRYSNLIDKYALEVRVGVVTLLLFGIMQRLYGVLPFGHIVGTRFDGILSVLLALFVVVVLRNWKRCYAVFEFLGKHSINIYLIHTFFNYYWASIHSVLHTNQYMRFIGVNMWVLLGICLCASIAIEFIKGKIYWNKLTNKILAFIDKI